MVHLLAACSAPDSATVPLATATLDDLTVGGAAVRPAFRPDITAYMVGFDELGPDPVVQATPTDAAAAVVLPPTDALAPGDRLEIEVVTADGSARRTYTVVLLPDDFPEVSTAVSGEPSPGFTFLGTNAGPRGSYAMVLDAHGVPDWFRGFAGPPFDFRQAPTGELTCVTLIDGEDVGLVLDRQTGAELRRISPVGTVGGQRPRMDVHELSLQEDGGAWLMGTVLGDKDLSPWGGPPDAEVVHHVVQHVAADGTLLFEWTSDGAVDWDTVPLWLDDPLYEGAWVYAHANSIAIDPADGNLVVSLRLENQAVKVATAATSFRGRDVAAGEVMWRLGGVDSDFTFVGDDRGDGWVGFAGQHSVRPVGDDSSPPNHLVVFDNALARSGLGESLAGQDIEVTVTGAPRFAEYALDLEAMTATLVTEHTWPAEVPIVAGGSVQRLDDGHTIIGWGDLPTDDPGPAVTEIDAAGDVVLEVTLPDGTWSYRAWRLE